MVDEHVTYRFEEKNNNTVALNNLLMNSLLAISWLVNMRDLF